MRETPVILTSQFWRTSTPTPAHVLLTLALGVVVGFCPAASLTLLGMSAAFVLILAMTFGA